jgi:hypothetical protein
VGRRAGDIGRGVGKGREGSGKEGEKEVGVRVWDTSSCLQRLLGSRNLVLSN